MTSLSRVPPGRAGRLWLRRRLDTAERGLDLLDRKLRILRKEHERLALVAERTNAEWTAACADADAWLLRASLAGGRRSLRPAAGLADVTVRWTHAMGTGYPEDASCRLPAAPPSLACSAALVRAREAYRIAIEAGVRHAAAHEAERILAREIAATRQRIRALKDRWIPRLTAAMAEIDLALDEMERSDAARLLRVTGPTASNVNHRPGRTVR